MQFCAYSWLCGPAYYTWRTASLDLHSMAVKYHLPKGTFSFVFIPWMHFPTVSICSVHLYKQCFLNFSVYSLLHPCLLVYLINSVYTIFKKPLNITSLVTSWFPKRRFFLFLCFAKSAFFFLLKFANHGQHGGTLL